MRRGNAVGAFIGLVTVLTWLYSLSPTLFYELPFVPALGMFAIVFGGIGVVELMNQGKTIVEAVGAVVFVGVAGAALMGGFMSYVLHTPIQFMPASVLRSAPEHLWFLPQVMR